MTAAMIEAIESELTFWQSWSHIKSPSYFAASIMSDVQEALVRGLDKTARVGLESAAYFLDKDGRSDWAEATRALLADLDAPVHSVYYATEDGHNVYGLESRVTEGLNDIKRQIFEMIRKEHLI